ncbi:MAG: PIN domain-containing protein [Chloroflexi bacterium]|nr:PIN domain-containing protein [Chloroflexota bacterium]
MRSIFVDTSAFIACTDQADQFNEDALDLLQRLLDSRLPQVTTNYVLAEAYTRIRRKLGHQAAVKFGDGTRKLIAGGELQVIYADVALDQAAWEIFKKYADQNFSFVDCTSFTWLRQHPDSEVFAFDEDFTWMGFLPFQG